MGCPQLNPHCSSQAHTPHLSCGLRLPPLRPAPCMPCLSCEKEGLTHRPLQQSHPLSATSKQRPAGSVHKGTVIQALPPRAQNNTGCRKEGTELSRNKGLCHQGPDVDGGMWTVCAQATHAHLRTKGHMSAGTSTPSLNCAPSCLHLGHCMRPQFRDTLGSQEGTSIRLHGTSSVDGGTESTLPV